MQVYALELLITAKQAGQSNPEADQMMSPGLTEGPVGDTVQLNHIEPFIKWEMLLIV